MFLLFNPITATSGNPGIYRFITAESAPSHNTNRNVMKLTFSGPKGAFGPAIYWVDPVEKAKIRLESWPEANSNRFCVLIPTDYPSDLTDIRLVFIADQPTKSTTFWTVTGFPPQTSSLPDLQPTAELTNGATLSGIAYYSPDDCMYWSQVHITPPVAGEGWYWRGLTGVPYSPSTDVSQLSGFGMESKVTQGDADFGDAHPFITQYDRVRVEGSLDHYVSFPETLQFQVKPSAILSDLGTKYWKMGNETVASTPSGLQLLARDPDPAFNSLHAPRPFELTFEILFDPRTLENGLPQEPDRIDLEILQKDGRWREIEASLNVSWLKKNQRRIGVTIYPESPAETTVTLRITRRTRDQYLPFSLVVPLKRQPEERVQDFPFTPPKTEP